MKILYITNLPSPYRVEFFNKLSKYCDLTVLIERKKANDRNDKWFNEKINFKAIFLKSKKLGNESSLSFEIIKYLKCDYHIIILGGYSSPTDMIASLYMKLHKIPYVLNADGGFINYNEKKINMYIKRFFISSAKYWLSSGKETNKYLIYYGAKKKNIYNFPFTSLNKSDILTNPISKYEKLLLKQEKGIFEERVILSIGRYIYIKGFDWMINAYKELDKNTGVYIIGGVPSQEYIDLKEKNNMYNLHFVDFQNKSEILKWYRLADIFVLPTRGDVWGLVINEAMSQGLPVITTNRCIAGLEMIESGTNGYIVPVGDERALLNVTNNLLKSNIDYIATKNIEKSQYYTLENMAISTIEILKRIKKKEEKN